MQRILQVSDFHIKAGMAEPKSNPVFSSMVETLKGLHLNESNELILVYNGDVIDSKEIKSHIDPSLSDEKKAAKWDEEADLSYDKAAKYFNYLIGELCIRKDHIIICCGNHDINEYYVPDKDIPCYLPDANKRYAEKRFGKFAHFCQTIQGETITPGTYPKKIGELNFLVINSNWINKRTPDGEIQPLCIGCKDVVDVIEKNEHALNQTKNKYSRLLNVLVAHAPRTDYCENSLYKFPGWDGDLKETTDTLIDRNYGLKLYGDKHTDSDHNFDYIVGAPLDSSKEIISCGIHEFDNKYRHSHKRMVFRDGSWTVQSSEKDIERVLSLSRDYIKDQALKYLFGAGKDKLDLAEIITKFEEHRLDENWIHLDNLFRACCDLKEEKTRIQVDVKDGLINTLTRIITESRYNEKNIVTVKGAYRVGKSVCMSTLYLNMLFRFSTSTIEYMPVYIDISRIKDNILAQKPDVNINTKRFGSLFSTAFNTCLSDGINCANDIQRPACIIIDGIDMYTLYTKPDIEKKVLQAMQTGAGKDYKKVVYCIDYGPGGELESEIQKMKESQFLMYVNARRTKGVYQNDKYPLFIDAFCRLRGITKDKEIQKIKDRIDTLNIMELDTNLLLHIWEDLTADKLENPEYVYFRIVEGMAKSRINEAEINSAAKICRRLLSNNGRIKYDSIIGNTRNAISHKTFETIRTQREIGIYLKALNYCNCITKCDNLDEYETASVNELLDHEVCSFIRSYFVMHGQESIIIQFAQRNYENLSYGGKATITYLLGRLDKSQYGQEVGRLLQEEQKILKESPVEPDVERIKKIAQRSITISSIFMGRGEESLVMYLQNLIKSDEARRVNRAFYLQFYGDRDINNHQDVVYPGQDFFNTYHLLANRLKKYTTDKKAYPLLPLELFTLCDLLQVRIDSPNAVSRKPQQSNRIPMSLFYEEEYNKPRNDSTYNSLVFVNSIIEKYISSYGTKEKYELFIAYLKTQKQFFESCLEKLKNGPLKREDSFCPIKVYEDLIGFKDVKRLGWYYDTTPKKKIRSAEVHAYVNEIDSMIESDMEHTFECYIIGLLYLPDRNPNRKKYPKYNKQEILNILMIHDLGEIGSGDILPLMEDWDDIRKQEKAFNEALYVMGTKPEISNLTEYFGLWKKWEKKEHCNAKIAKDIDKIQMVYKMLKLIRDKKIHFTEERIKSFWRERDELLTDIGKHIYNILIANNSEFKEIETADKKKIQTMVSFDEVK